MFNKQNFYSGEIVEIHSTTDTKLDGQYCEVLGKSFINVNDHYIIMLQYPIDDNDFTYRAISLTESCLRRI